MKCWHTNADSLVYKLDELWCMIKVTSADILSVTEVYAKNCVYDVSPVLLQIDGYDCFVSSFYRGSCGVCIYVKSSLHASILTLTLVRVYGAQLWCVVLTL